MDVVLALTTEEIALIRHCLLCQSFDDRRAAQELAYAGRDERAKDRRERAEKIDALIEQIRRAE